MTERKRNYKARRQAPVTGKRLREPLEVSELVGKTIYYYERQGTRLNTTAGTAYTVRGVTRADGAWIIDVTDEVGNLCTTTISGSRMECLLKFGLVSFMERKDAGNRYMMYSLTKRLK